MPSTGPRDPLPRKVIDKVLRTRAEAHGAGRRTPAFAEAVRALEAIETAHRLGLTERMELRNALARELVDQVEAQAQALPPLPKRPPEAWSDRKGRKENPVTFIRRVYAPWLYRGLVRGDLRALDPQLYRALAVWMHRHPDERFPELDAPFDGIGDSVDKALETILAAPRSRTRRAKLPYLRNK